MYISQRAARGNTFSKVVFGLAAMVLLFAPPTARPGRAAEATPRNPLDLKVCRGYFALCAASTCTPQPGKLIAVNTLTGRPSYFPQADCTCPVILGQSLADLAGGNMQGSCDPPGPGQLWSEYQIRADIPQAITDWVPHLPEDFAPPQICPASLHLGNQYAQCYSMACDDEHYINNVPVVTCHCALGATLFGIPANPDSSFTILAGQRDPSFCAEHPISNVINVSSP